MQTPHDRTVAELMEQLIETGPEGMAVAFTAMLNWPCASSASAMSARRPPSARPSAAATPTATRRQEARHSSGHADGAGPKEPRRRGAVLSAGARTGAALLARGDARHRPNVHPPIAGQGVSTRDVEKVMAEFGLESLSSTQVSRAAALMDEELEAWRTRQLGAFPYLFLPLPVPGARYGKVRIDGVVRDAAILSAIGIDEDGKRSVLGISVALSEAEIHWRGFLDSLVARGLRGVRCITSNDHAGLPNQRLGRPQGRFPWRGLAAMPVPPGPQRHPPRPLSFRTNEAALERLATAILVEIDEEWIATDRTYITMTSRDG